MYRFKPIFLLVFFGCAGPASKSFILKPKKSFNELKSEFDTCNGKGSIDLTGPMQGKFSFSYKSNKDSTFLEFNDLIGRKAMLMWITDKNIIARNLIENRRYDSSEILGIFPLLSIMQPKDITKILWGIKPDYKNKLNASEYSIKKNILIEFFYKDIKNEKEALAGITYFNKSSKQLFNIDIRTRNRNNQNQSMKKVWKLLEY
mgnify:CR=1 FL=1